MALLTVLLAAAPAAARAQVSGFALQGEAGAGQLVNGISTNTSSTWGAIFGIFLGGWLGFEGEYQHMQNDVNGIASISRLKSEGVIGHVRVDFLPGPLQPFAYGGIGWLRLSPTQSATSATNDRAVFPLGAGVEYQLKPLVFGARGEYQWIVNDVAGKSVDAWKVVGTIGVRIP
jgi:opacity protein-like surface antigen